MKHETPPVVAGAVIRQGGRTCLHRLTNTTPVLIHVRSGNKVVVIRDTPLLLTAGEFGLLPDHQPMTMENIPKAPQNYEARILPVSRPLFEETYARLAFITPPRTALPVKALHLPAEAVALFDFCCSPENFSRLPAPVATVRLMELITWFALSGAVLGVQGNPLLQHRLRQMIEAEPARNWTLGQAARSFNMSEATLRRKLAAENTSFTETLSDTRMTRRWRCCKRPPCRSPMSPRRSATTRHRSSRQGSRRDSASIRARYAAISEFLSGSGQKLSRSGETLCPSGDRVSLSDHLIVSLKH
ncbi:Transcriptional regulator, AraC family [Sinorhizobium sp. CCBAU 05631]|nr:Transcriptional regulator, AraC family [Sinorhizobium sp. CCBAU 05631]